jgi:sulfhydrogenase subunit beta (sulfur reductase)
MPGPAAYSWGRMAAVQVIERDDFDALLDALSARGYTIVGPTLREQTIIYDEVSSSADLPVGWTDEQDGGHDRLKRRDDEALFGYAVGPHSFKQYQLPAEVKLWRARVDGHGRLSEVEEAPRESPRYAFLGARSCELHGIEILGRVLLGSRHPDPADRARVDQLFIVAVQCGQAGGTCFCVSMNTGPVADRGFDLALTEILDGDRHYFTVEVGSERGAEVLADVPHRAGAPDDEAAAHHVHERTAAQMGRELDHDRHQGTAVSQLRPSALGRGGRSLPDLRQLHDGLPDLLLHDRRGRDRSRR